MKNIPDDIIGKKVYTAYYRRGKVFIEQNVVTWSENSFKVKVMSNTAGHDGYLFCSEIELTPRESVVSLKSLAEERIERLKSEMATWESVKEQTTRKLESMKENPSE